MVFVLELYRNGTNHSVVYCYLPGCVLEYYYGTIPIQCMYEYYAMIVRDCT